MTSKKKLKKNVKGEPSQASIYKKLPYRLLCSYDKLVHIDDLHLNPDNPNKHPDKQIAMYAQIMSDNGVRRPVRVSTRSGLVTAGHGEILAFKINGWDYVPIDFQDYEDAADEWNDVVADNSLAQMSELDLGKVNEVIVDLGPDYDVDKMGLPNFKVEPADKGDQEPGAKTDTELELEAFGKINGILKPFKPEQRRAILKACLKEIEQPKK